MRFKQDPQGVEAAVGGNGAAGMDFHRGAAYLLRGLPGERSRPDPFSRFDHLQSGAFFLCLAADQASKGAEEKGAASEAVSRSCSLATASISLMRFSWLTRVALGS